MFLGCSNFAWDQWRKRSSILDLAVLGTEETVWPLPESAIWAIHMPNPGLLISSVFDGTEALIAMTNEAFEIADPERFFEIEPVDDQTYQDWLNPKDFFERDA